jgi:hypothetical protein
VTPAVAATLAEPEDAREAGRMSACAKEPSRPTEVFHVELGMGAREAGRMSACAKEPSRPTEVFHIQAR